MASGGGTQDHSVILWDMATGVRLQRLDIGSQVCQLRWYNQTDSFEKPDRSSTENGVEAGRNITNDYTPTQDPYRLIVAEGYSSSKISVLQVAPFLHSIFYQSVLTA